MTFELMCKGDAKKLGIEDSQGNWNKNKFWIHIENCRKCSRLVEDILRAVFEESGGIVLEKKGSQVNDRP